MAFLHFDTNRPAHFLSDWGVPIAAAAIVGCWVALMLWLSALAGTDRQFHAIRREARLRILDRLVAAVDIDATCDQYDGAG